MGYQRNGKQAHAAARSWDQWLAQYQSALLECGLSPTVLRDHDHWCDFLEHGYLDHHDDPTGFSIDAVPPDRAGGLVRLLESMLPQDEWASAIALLQLRKIARDASA